MKQFNLLDLFVSMYAALHNYRGLHYRVLSPFRGLMRVVSGCILPHYLARSTAVDASRQVDVIVSFTSFPARIGEVWQVVECMFRQTYLPKRIILWLSKEQFPTADGVPASLKEREGSLFEIRLVDGDIRSHKKYYYVSKEYPDSLVLLIDDDLYYPTDMIEKLVNERASYPNSFVCRYAFKMLYSRDGNMLPYNYWREYNGASEGNAVFFGTGGGVLFKPSMLYKDLVDPDLFLKLTPLADDVWLNAMVRLSKLNIRKIKCGLLLPVKSKGPKITLCSQNVGDGKNDEQIRSVIEYYIKAIGINPFALKRE